MERVLQIPELLGYVFGYLDIRTRLSCTLVCTTWTDAALDTLWKELDSPKPLLSLLSPLESDGEHVRSKKFRDPVLRDNWVVFDRYARRVRVLTVDFTTEDLSSSIFFEVAQKRPSLTLLPSLKSLILRPERLEDFVHVLLFMSPSVEALRLCYTRPALMNEFARNCISEFFDECSSRMPNVKRFAIDSIESPWSINDLEPSLSKYLASLTDLEVFNCPLNCLVPSIVLALSQLPSINIISLAEPSYVGHGSPSQIVPFGPSLHPGSFAALVDLSFSAPFMDASSFVNIDFAPTLITLWIHSPVSETTEALHSLIVSLSKRRSKLKELCIDAVPFAVRRPLRDEDGNEVDVVTLQTLLPLLDFPDMKRFEIAYHRPFQLNNEDVRTLLARWPTLEHFHLASDPLIKEKPTLTLDVLPIIARSCPDLHTVSVYLDTHVNVELPFTSASSPLDRASFRRLKSIAFGMSVIQEDDVQNFSLYLSDILPHSYKAKDNPLCGASWIKIDRLETDGFVMRNEEVEQWKMAAWALQVLIEARAQERQRVRTLEKEAQDLRMRVAMLAEQGRLGLSALTEAEKGRVCVHQ